MKLMIAECDHVSIDIYAEARTQNLLVFIKEN